MLNKWQHLVQAKKVGLSTPNEDEPLRKNTRKKIKMQWNV